MIELGGNIKLGGHFKELDHPTLIIVKKIVGNYAKRIGEEAKDFSELFLDLKKEDNYQLKATLKTQTNNINAEASETNIFFALNKALNAIYTEAKK